MGEKPAPRSMRDHLILQGVTEESSIRAHIRFVYELQKRTLSRLDLTKYRVNPDNPNSVVPYMG